MATLCGRVCGTPPHLNNALNRSWLRKSFKKSSGKSFGSHFSGPNKTFRSQKKATCHLSSSYNLTFVKNTILQRDSLLKILIHLGRIYFALGEGGTGWGRIWAAHTCRLFQRFLPRRSFTKAVILSTQTEMCRKLGWPSGTYTSVSATTFSHLSHLGDLDHFELCHSWYFSVQFKFECKGK